MLLKDCNFERFAQHFPEYEIELITTFANKTVNINKIIKFFQLTISIRFGWDIWIATLMKSSSLKWISWADIDVADAILRQRIGVVAEVT